jgi:hypothetical protein
MAESLDDRQQEFIARLGALLGEFADVIGPYKEADREGLVVYDAEDMRNMTPVDNAALNEWMILTSWMDLEDGDTYTSAFCTPKMPTYHRLGMLMTWMEAWK